jgi:hypothetical protein
MIDHIQLKRLAEAANALSDGAPWAYEPHGDSGDYGVGVLVNEEGNYVEGRQESCSMSVCVPVAPEVDGQVFAAFVAAANPSAVLALIAENEALRDDLEQEKYDLDAWKNREESVWIQVFLGQGDDPFISAVSGAICIEQISLMQVDLKEYAEDYFEKGPGFYVFECRHFDAHYDNVGMTEPAHWEMDFSEYTQFPWADEQDVDRVTAGEGEQP